MNTLHFTSLHITTLHITLLHITLYEYTALHFTSYHYTSHNTATHHIISLHFRWYCYISHYMNTLHFTSLHITTLHITTFQSSIPLLIHSSISLLLSCQLNSIIMNNCLIDCRLDSITDRSIDIKDKPYSYLSKLVCWKLTFIIFPFLYHNIFFLWRLQEVTNRFYWKINPPIYWKIHQLIL